MVTAGGVQVEQLVLEELHRIRKEGFTASAIDAAINTTEFSLRENNTGRFPRGLSMMLRAMNAWVYERDPYKCAPTPAACAASPVRKYQVFVSLRIMKREGSLWGRPGRMSQVLCGACAWSC